VLLDNQKSCPQEKMYLLFKALVKQNMPRPAIAAKINVYIPDLLWGFSLDRS